MSSRCTVSATQHKWLFNVPLPLVSTPLTMLIWLAVVLIGSAVASAVPAWRASRLTIRETLAYV